MIRWLTWLVVVIALIGTGFYVARGPVALAVMERALNRAMTRDRMAALPDGITLGLCGTGSPLADGDRAGPCAAVAAGRHLFVFDVGEGSVRNLTRMGLTPSRVDAVFLTHFHSDHIDSLGALMLQRWAGGGATAPLAIHGPVGVGTVVDGFNTAYRLDSGYRVAHHGADIVPPTGFGGTAVDFGTPGPDPVKVYDQDGVVIEAFAVNHQPVEPSVGYRISYKGRVVVITGDTAKSSAVEAASKGADLLLHEALAPNLVAMMRQVAEKAGRAHIAKILGDIPGYHTSPEEAAALAQAAGVKFLVLTHIVPPLPLPGLDVPFLGKSRTLFTGRLHIGHDGDMIMLPAGATTIEVRRADL